MYDLPPELDVRADGPVRIVTLNRPEALNAANGALHTALTQVWRRISSDPDARAVVLTGAGRAFSAGGDFAWMTSYQQDADYRRRLAVEIRAIITEMVTFPLPLVAAVNGPAVGFGASLAVTCDIVLLSDRSFLADPHISVGLVCGDGGAAIWPALTSLLRAKEYLFTGDRIAPETAVAIGLANRVVPHDTLFADARTLAQRLAAQPRQALTDTKRALNAHLEHAIAGALDLAVAAERESMGSAEHIERVAALREKSRARPS